jgi:glucans biosynthesis protein C
MIAQRAVVFRSGLTGPLPWAAAHVDHRALNVDNIRLLATFLLISYHVIGSSSGVGVRVSDDSVYRYISEYFAAVRMPTFAFIAGVVYALRPAQRDTLARFASGKVRRLLAPGAVAVTIYAILGVVALGRAIQVDDLWRIYLTPFLHFWFLQAIFVILVLFGLADAATRNRGEMLFVPVAATLFFVGPALAPTTFGLASATYLFPFFLVGVVTQRRWDWIIARRRAFIWLGLALIAALTAHFLHQAFAGGVVQTERRSLYALAFGIIAPVWLLLATPRLPGAKALAAFGLTIYLYHIIGTSLMRRSLDGFGVEDMTAHLVLGVVAGFALPIAVHLAAERSAFLRRTVLGQKG